MTQFDIFEFDFPGRGKHPAVIISHPDIAARASMVNILYCTSQRQVRPIKPFEVMLDSEDGLDWETLVNCLMNWQAPSDLLTRKLGHVTYERRQALRAKLRFCFLLDAVN